MQNWLSYLQQWITSLFKKKRKYRSQIIKRIDGQVTTMLRLERETPGAIATYRIFSAYSNRAYLLTLDSITSVNTEMVGEFNGTRFKLRSSAYSRSSAPTHRFAFFEVGNSGTAIPIHVWDVDLQGSASSIRGERAAERAIAATALYPLLIVDQVSWDWQMRNIDWLALLEQNIKAELGQFHQMKARVVAIESESKSSGN